MIVAAASNNAIGRNNELLWRLPADMKFFKNTTWAMPVIMGRKTFEALGKPLSGRFNIVISRNKDFKPEGAVRVDDLEAALEAADIMKTKEIFIIGGGQIYEQAMPVTNRIYLTRVHAELEGDAFFPSLKPEEWHIARKNDFLKDEKHAYDYSFETWERNS
jgi:dihydrofolate reductase